MKWTEILPRVPLGPSSRHLFKLVGVPEGTQYNHVKLNMYPDGGIVRYFIILGYSILTNFNLRPDSECMVSLTLSSLKTLPECSTWHTSSPGADLSSLLTNILVPVLTSFSLAGERIWVMAGKPNAAEERDTRIG